MIPQQLCCDSIFYEHRTELLTSAKVFGIIEAGAAKGRDGPYEILRIDTIS